MTDSLNLRPSRRLLLQGAAALGATSVASPFVLRAAAAQDAAIAPYQAAKVNWRQAEGEKISVAVIPAGYFENLIGLAAEFEALTGVQVRFEKVPPGQIRQKAVLDLSSGAGGFATHAADPMYYPLYVANKWVEPLDRYLADPTLTDPAWYNFDDVIPAWRAAASVDGKVYGAPYDGEVTVQVYRADLYDAKGLKPADTLEQFAANAAALHEPDKRLWGTALRGFAGAGQNVYIYSSIFRAYGGQWFDGGKVKVNGAAAAAALNWYVDTLTKYAPAAARNWNWPDIADAFAQGSLGSYIDAHSSAAVLNNPEKSQVVGKIGFARWPVGPSGKRVSSLWNWSFPINAALSERAKRATWLFIAWATSAETQARTSWKFAGPAKRSGLNRLSLWRSAEFAAFAQTNGRGFVEAAAQSLEQDVDVDWRPRLPQWPAVGDTLAAAIQTALSGQKNAKAALDEAQARIDQILKG